MPQAPTLERPRERPTPETRELGIVSRELAIRPGSFDEQARTVDVVFTTGARRTMVHWRGWDPEYVDEELDTARSAVRLDRINRGGPVLNSHSSWDLSRQIGVVVEGSARMEGGEGVATLRLSNREDVAGIVQDIRDGIIRNISVGYIVHRYEVTEPETRNERPLWRAVDWEPVEISFVPIPADSGAGTRGADPQQGGFPCVISRAAQEAPAPQEVRMTNPNEQPAGQDAPAVATEQRTAAPAPTPAAPTTVSVETVLDMAARAALPEREQLELVAAHRAAPFTHEALIAEIGKRWAAKDQAPVTHQGSSARVTVDEREKLRGAAIEAIAHRGSASREALKQGGEHFRGRSLVEIGAELAGINVRGLTRAEMVEEVLARSTHVTSDFPLVLAAVSNKFLRNSYEAAPRTFLPFTRVRTVPDFKNINVVALGDAPRLLQIPTGGEVKWGTIGEDSQVYAVASYGRALTVSRVMLVNDDLDAFARLPQMFGRAAADLEGDLIYTGILMGNPNLRTGGALFQNAAARGNNLAAAGSAITVDNVGVGESVMMSQRGIGPDGTATGGAPINVRPQFLITGTARSVAARQLVASTIVPSQTSAVNPFAGQLQAITDSRITGNTWFLAASPNQIDTLEMAYLEGAVGPTVSQFAEVTRDGISVRAIHDVGAAAIDYRGLYRNPGA